MVCVCSIITSESCHWTGLGDDDKRSHSPPPYALHKKVAVLPPPCPAYGVRQPTVPPGKPTVQACKMVPNVKNMYLECLLISIVLVYVHILYVAICSWKCWLYFLIIERNFSFAVKNMKRRTASSAARDSPVISAQVIKEPETVLSVKPAMSSSTDDITQSDMDNASSSSSMIVTNAADTDSHCLSKEEEVDSSSQPQLSPNNSDMHSTSQYFVSSSGNQPLKELPKLHKAARWVYVIFLHVEIMFLPLYSVGDIHKIQYLINHGANINQTDCEEKTALMHWWALFEVYINKPTCGTLLVFIQKAFTLPVLTSW